MKLRLITNERGNALLETVPCLVIFVALMSFALGIFGIVHTAVLHSIAARTYSFETFRQRTNLNYFREDGSGENPATSINFSKMGWRFQAVNHESDARDKFVATVRPIALGRGVAESQNSEQVYNTTIFEMQPRNNRISVNPAWIMVGYGICMNATCGN